MQNITIDWEQLKIVLTIARAGNLSQAARILGVNQTTVGRRLNALEQQLGVALFFRSRQVMIPTEHGKTVVIQAETMESAVHNAVEQLGKTKTDPAGLIRFVAMPWICNYLIAPNLGSFFARYPGIEVEAVAAARERFLDRGEVEMALRFEMPPRGQAENIPLVHVPYAIYGPADKDPKGLPWLGFREDQAIFAPEEWMQNRDDGSPVRFWANDIGFLYQGVRNGLGKSILPMVLAEDDPRLTRLSGPEPEIERVLHLQVLPNIQRLKRVTVFIEWLSEILNAAFSGHKKQQT